MPVTVLDGGYSLFEALSTVNLLAADNHDSRVNDPQSPANDNNKGLRQTTQENKFQNSGSLRHTA
jgi:hypothetical protein